MSQTTSISTIYPSLQAADPGRPSLADLPLEIVLAILDTLWAVAQIIPIDIHGSQTEEEPKDVDMDGKASHATKIFLRPPPLYTAASTCRLFMHSYRKSRPQTWGFHLASLHNYHVDLQKDIFHVRIHRRVHPFEWDREGESHLDPLYGKLNGIERIATSANYLSVDVNPWGSNYLRHLNPNFKELMVLVPHPGVQSSRRCTAFRLKYGGEGGSLLKMSSKQRIAVPDASAQKESMSWGEFGDSVRTLMYLTHRLYRRKVRDEEHRKLWETNWRLCPLPSVRGYIVDAEELNDPEAFGLARN